MGRYMQNTALPLRYIRNLLPSILWGKRKCCPLGIRNYVRVG